MPPKLYDTRPTPEEQQQVEEETARAARTVVASYSNDFLDGITLASMLGIEPEGLVYKEVLDELGLEPEDPDDPAPKKITKKSAAKKTPAKKTTAKKTTKKTAAKKSPAKKSTKKTT